MEWIRKKYKIDGSLVHVTVNIDDYGSSLTRTEILFTIQGSSVDMKFIVLVEASPSGFVQFHYMDSPYLICIKTCGISGVITSIIECVRSRKSVKQVIDCLIRKGINIPEGIVKCLMACAK